MSQGEQQWAEIKEAEERDGRWDGRERLIALMSLRCGSCGAQVPVHVRMLLGTSWAAFDGDAIKDHLLTHMEEEAATQMAGMMMAYFMDRVKANNETRDAMKRILRALHQLGSERIREIASKARKHGGLLEWVKEGMP